MLLRREVLEAIEAGRVDTVYRRWQKPRVRPGSTLRTPVGVLQVTSIERVEPETLGQKDAAEAGFTDLESLLTSAGDRGPILYRIGLRHIGPDPRSALRDTIPDDIEIERIESRLDRLDEASRNGPWTRQTLRLIEQQPGVRAENLAQSLGREKMPFKLDVRKLKELGLTESLRVGYRLSPRGKTVLDRLD